MGRALVMIHAAAGIRHSFRPVSQNLCIAAKFCRPFAPPFWRSVGNAGVLSE
jgi:hypothetical protein